jgi:hypothetical protein
MLAENRYMLRVPAPLCWFPDVYCIGLWVVFAQRLMQMLAQCRYDTMTGDGSASDAGDDRLLCQDFQLARKKVPELVDLPVLLFCFHRS